MLIRVDSKDIKGIFEDIKPIFRNSEDSRVVAFTAKDNILDVTVSNGLVYQKSIHARTEGFFTVTALYVDLSELIDSKGECEITLNSTSVILESSTFTATMISAQTVVSNYKVTASNTIPIATGDLVRAIRKMSETSVLSKIFMREAAVVFANGSCIIKYPTVWVEAPMPSIADTSMSMRDALCIANFKPTSVGYTDDVLEFHRDTAILAVPRNRVSSLEDVVSKKEDMGHRGILLTASLLSRIQRLIKGVGAGSAKYTIYENGISIDVMRQSISTQMNVGGSDNKIAFFELPLEYMALCLKLAEESPLELYLGGDRLLLLNHNTAILISVLS